MTITMNCAQGESEWLKMRCGLPTASNFKKLLTSKGKKSTQWKAYMYKLAAERITGEVHQEFYGHDMELGNEREAEARDTYSFIKEVSVKEVGFIFKDKEKLFGYSPDGLVSDDGLIEIKNCQPKIQIERIAKQWNGVEHYQQIQGGLFISGRKWCDLISFCRGLKLYVVRIYPDPDFFKALEKSLIDFCLTLEQTILAYRIHEENENTLRVLENNEVKLLRGN